VFQRFFWEHRFITLPSLQNHWVQVQQWAMGMVVALHCLHLFNGNTLKDNMRALPPFPFALMTLFEEHYKVNYCFEERRYRELNLDDSPEGLSLRSLPPIFWDAVTTPEDSSTSSSQEAVKTLEASLDKTISSGEMVLTQMEKLLTSIKGYLVGQKDIESGEVVESFSRPPTPVPELIYDSPSLRPSALSFVPGKAGLLAQPLPNRPLESYKAKLARVALAQHRRWMLENRIREAQKANAEQNGHGEAPPGSSRFDGLPNAAQGSNRYEALPVPGPTFLGVSIPAFTVSDQIKLNDHSEDRTRTPAPPSPRVSAIRGVPI